MRNRQHLVPVIESLPSSVVACVGDVMLDHFVHGEVSRISPEAPIPVLRIERRQFMLGGAGNAVRNLNSLGCRSWFFSVTGDDDEAARVSQLLAALPGNSAHLEREAGRQTPVKTRYVAHGQQLLRADSETAAAVKPETARQVLAAFEAALSQCSIVLLSDYAKGVLNGDYVQQFIRAARAAGKPVIVDPKGRDFSRYRGASVIKPNLKELGEATGMPLGGDAAQEAAARQLLKDTEAEYILLTRGAEGMMLTPANGLVLRFPSMAREVYDVSGAGDTVAAVLAAALGSGAPIADAVEIANIAAGIVVSKIGTAVAERQEIMDEVQYQEIRGAGSKILQMAQASELVRQWRQRGWTFGLACGSFDGLHPGHLKLLETARAHCDRLLVALASDASIRRANGRPTQNELARSLIVASLSCVDGVILFSDATPREQLRLLQPNLVIQQRPEETDGADVLQPDLVQQLVEQWGGEVLYVDDTMTRGVAGQ